MLGFAGVKMGTEFTIARDFASVNTGAGETQGPTQTHAPAHTNGKPSKSSLLGFDTVRFLEPL